MEGRNSPSMVWSMARLQSIVRAMGSAITPPMSAPWSARTSEYDWHSERSLEQARAGLAPAPSTACFNHCECAGQNLVVHSSHPDQRYEGRWVIDHDMVS